MISQWSSLSSVPIMAILLGSMLYSLIVTMIGNGDLIVVQDPILLLSIVRFLRHSGKTMWNNC